MLMRGDVRTYLILVLSTLFFILGVSIVEKISFSDKKNQTGIKNNGLVFYFPQSLSLFGNLILIFTLERAIGISYLIQNSLSDTSPALRASVFEFMSGANLSWVTPVGYFAIVSGYWYLGTNKSTPLFEKMVYSISLSLSILGAFIQLSKAPIISIIILLFSCYVIVGSYLSQLNARKLLTYAVGIIVLVAILFYFLQSKRYSAIAGSGFTQLIGYFPASYNRLAALLDGTLVMPAKDGFYYTNLGLWTFPAVGGVARDVFGDFMGIDIPKNNFDVWMGGFGSMSTAGLNRNFIWITTYGEAFQDYGWLSPLWFCIYGMFMGVFWKLLLQKDIIGLFVYPILILTMQWWSIASIFSRDTIIVILIAVILKSAITVKLPRITQKRS